MTPTSGRTLADLVSDRFDRRAHGGFELVEKAFMRA